MSLMLGGRKQIGVLLKFSVVKEYGNVNEQSTPPDPFREISVHMLSALATTHLEAQMEQERKVIKDPHLAIYWVGYRAVFRFEPLSIAVEWRDIEAAQCLVSSAIKCGITSADGKRFIEWGFYKNGGSMV
ncbi:hypothetical protein NC651_026183 [Populus alba x Populus x berolinensis]|nr:hypothetical protein NC651_026183 [Populus alba x Populus x berolinensis]